MIDHDRLFKELIATFFLEFLELFLPSMSAFMDADSIVFLDKELFTDVTSGDRHEADLIVKARFKNQESFFLIHVENQAQPQPQFGQRMFSYFARLYDKHRLPVYPIVIFSYDKPRRKQAAAHRVTFPDLDVLAFHYRVIQLNQYRWQDYARTENPVASALMAKMQIAVKERPRVKLECTRLLATLKLDRARMQLIAGFVDSYLKLTAAEMKMFTRELKRLAPAEQEKVMELTNSWIESGRRQGLQQGKREGLQQGKREGLRQGKREGEAALVLRLLRRRIGALERVSEERIRSLTLAQIERLAEALLDFREPQDLTRWLQKHLKR
ncbi:MAG: DUF4351 domain-containing protein [Acidobacteriota bacterium]